MERDPIWVCREYLRSSSPETRRKAVAALEALADPEAPTDPRASAALDPETRGACAAELARRALEDGDERVRERASDAIARLDLASRGVAIDRFQEALGRPGQELRAHALLTEMRNRGLTDEGRGLSLARRFRLAFRARRAAARERGRKFQAEAYPWSLGFALLGAILVIFLVASQVRAASPWPVLIFTTIAVATAPLVARSACASAQRGDQYLDRSVGWLAEIFGTGADALPVMAPLGVVTLLLWPPLAATHGATVAWMGLGLLAGSWGQVATIRAATLSTSVLARRSWWSTLAGAGAGWGAGMAASTATLYALARVAGPRPEGEEVVAFAAGLWLLGLPLSAGVAAAFARLERDAVPPSKLRWKTLFSLPSLISGVLLIVGWTWLFLPLARPGVLAAEAEPHTRTETFAFERIPAFVDLRVDFRQKIRARIPSERGTAGERVLRLWRGQNLVLSQPRLLETELTAGGYRLELVEAPPPAGSFRAAPFEEFFDVAQRLAHLAELPSPYALGARKADPFELEVTLNLDPVFAISSRIPALLVEGEVAKAFETFDRAVGERPELGTSVVLLDRFCRLGSLTLLRGGKSAVGNLGLDNLSRLAGLCDRAVELADGNAAVRESRAFARLLVSSDEGAIEDFESFARATSDPAEAARRRAWIDALRASAHRSAEAVPRSEIDLLLAEHEARDVAGWTRAAARDHLVRGAELLWEVLGADTPPPPTDGRAEEALASFELAVDMVPALAEDAGFQRYVCRLGALSAPRHPAVALACGKASKLDSGGDARVSQALVQAASGEVEGAIATLEALPAESTSAANERRVALLEGLRELGEPPPEILGELHREAVERAVPTLPAVDFTTAPPTPGPGGAAP